MNLYTIAEPMFSRSLWYRAAAAGVRQSKNGRRLHICQGTADAEFLEAVRADTGALWLLGSSARWMRAVLHKVTEYGIFPVLCGVGTVDCSAPHCLITQDYTRSARELTLRLAAAGCRRVAFFGCNPDSNTDRLKLAGYRAARGTSAEEDIFFNRGDIAACIGEFLARRGAYDGILFTNVYVCAALLTELGTDTPAAACFGDSPLLDYLCPSAPRAALDYRLAGEKAADLYPYLCEGGRELRMTVTIPSKFRPDSGEVSAAPVTAAERIDPFDPFYGDPAIQRAAQLEQLLVSTTEDDLHILSALREGSTYEQTAALCCMGVSSIKYRLRRLKSMGGYGTTEELVRDFAALTGK